MAKRPPKTPAKLSSAHPLIPCSCCAGSGKVLLPASLLAALLLMRERGTITAAELAASSGHENKTITFANQRLEKLRALGLAYRVKSDWGRAFRYYEASNGIAVTLTKVSR